MRKIGILKTEGEAQRFGSFLFVKGIENDVEVGEAGVFEIWVHDDEQLALARRYLATFLADPGASEFAAEGEADRLRREQERADARRKSRVITRERLDYERSFAGFASIPLVLAALCLLATVFAGTLGIFPDNGATPTPESEQTKETQMRHWEFLMITKFRPPKLDTISQVVEFTGKARDGARVGSLFGDTSLPEVRHGEVWRLITPIFVHFGLLHLVFNLMWLRNLGGFFQNRFGFTHLAAFVFISGALSNYGQLLWSGPMFGGMSGVNYALFGFLWMRGRFDRFAAWSLNPSLIQTMMLWFGACLIGIIPNVANFSHGVGLVVGMAWGILSGKLSRGV